VTLATGTCHGKKRIKGKYVKKGKKEKKENEEMPVDAGGTVLDGNEGNFAEAAV